ncbi:glycosyltransferase family 4 protein [Bacillus sp. FJAT-53711]|uniref:Glycosyltransferase family 4 protein n=1 Tax=Bacillus yunxiaonensis TaxID=3127665 RepID=A0ABU8FZI4_9BACI
MPSSFYQAIPDILQHVIVEEPMSILDVGVGFGKYGLLLREALDVPYERYHKHEWQVVIDGIEVFEDYRNPVHEHIYNNMYYDNVFQKIDDLTKYDVILLADVIQHFTKGEGIRLLKQLLHHTNKALVVSTPIYSSYQLAYKGNSLEIHKSKWTIMDFQDFDFSCKELPIGGNGSQIIKIYPQKTRENKAIDLDRYITKDIEVLHNQEKKLCITYVLPHKNLTGGLKMLVDQMSWLKKRGHTVQGILRSDNSSSSIFHEHMQIEIDKEIHIAGNESYIPYLKGSDVVVAGWWQQIAELRYSMIPTLYWEQGHECLFGDMPFPTSDVTAIRNHMHASYRSNIFLFAVSDFVARVLQEKFGRKAPVITNGIDLTAFYPTKKEKKGNTILVVGNPYLKFKGAEVAIQALEHVQRKGVSFQVKWVMPYYMDLKPSLFSIEYVMNPDRTELAKQFREADVLLFPSHYEGFGLPPLEAMASGTPVVCTKCGGVETYAKHLYNALLYEPRDIEGLGSGIIDVLTNKALRMRLADKGLETAGQFAYAAKIEVLEEYIRKVASYSY